MKLSKEETARISGMQYALRIAKEGGVEALEKEVNFRCRYQIPIGIPSGVMDKLAQEINRNLPSTIKVITAISLRDEFRFGSERMKRFFRRFNENSDAVFKGYASLMDIQNALEEECGLREEDL